MNDTDFTEFIALCTSELAQKQSAAIEKFHIGSYKRYAFDQKNGKLQFKDDDGVTKQEFSVVIIGSYAHKSNSWMWAWVNGSLSDSFKEDSEQIKKLATITGFDIFSLPSFQAEPKMVDEVVAMAVHVLDSEFMYMIPGENNNIFFAIKHS